ncbi:MAG TPA: RimK family alpha-L-glutamate ligase [Methylophilus sp.]|nr:RimK family alpha-L-glutamate ligase [Methylophilus sp.]HQQ33646.1 RimK family alpha-L-glutamate ligase [Methylophilus sp.]
MKSVIIFTDEPDIHGGWHGKQLQSAFAKHSITVKFVSLSDCLLDFSGSNTQIRIPQFSQKPELVFVRAIAGGTLQQITTRLNVLHLLAMQGVIVVNSGKAIERTVDKAMTSFLLKQHDISTPATWVCESRQQAHALIHDQLNSNTKLLIKPLFGSQGRGIRLLDSQCVLPLPMDALVDGVFYLQQFIETGAQSHDYRVLVVKDEPVAAMRRNGQSWLNNVAQGAQCVWIDDRDILDLAVKAAQALEIDYCGVDVIRDVYGQLHVLEVNSIPAWRGLQGVTSFNIAQILADYAVGRARL